MKITKAETKPQVQELMRSLNDCHDASIRKVCFIKPREVDKISGSLIYPFQNIEDRTICDVEVELLLNSYPQAKKDQVVLLEFMGVKNLMLCQDEHQDYSDVYEVKVDFEDGQMMKVTFCSTEAKVPLLHLSCVQLICKEL